MSQRVHAKSIDIVGEDKARFFYELLEDRGVVAAMRVRPCGQRCSGSKKP